MIKRNLIIDIDGLEIRDPLKIIVVCAKDANSDQPDFAEILLVNLSEGTRSQVIKAKKIAIYAGHGDNANLVFLGDIQAVSNKKNDTEWETRILAGDGATVMRQSIINKTYRKPIKTKDLIRDIASSGGLADTVEFVDIPETTDILRGITLSAPTRTELSRICNPRGWTWNIQNEKLVVVGKEASRKKTAYDIGVDTGMIGSPEWINMGQGVSTDRKADPVKIRVKVLCIPSIRPKDKIKIRTSSLEGRIGSFTYAGEDTQRLNDFFTVENVTHNLDSRDGDFSSTIEATLKEGA